MPDSLIIQNLSLSVGGKIVVQKVNLTVNAGEVHVIMGPNGSGKSSLALALVGHHAYQVTEGKVTMGDYDLLSQKPNERVKIGLFLSFQNPVTLTGVTLGQLLLSSYKAIKNNEVNIKKFYSQIKKKAEFLGLKEETLERDVNDGFSGGEKKKAEMLMLLCLTPKFVIFDEIDSGLDVDTIKKVIGVINELLNKHTGIILITHNQKILKYIKPDLVHILKEGRIVKTGNQSLALEIEEKGYAKI